jgi:hypothetical protein
MVTFICDLLSPSAIDFPIVTRPCFADLLKDVPDDRQENSVPNPAEIPVHATPPPGRLYFRAVCRSFSISKILAVCKPLAVRPQVFFTAAEIYTISSIFKFQPDFDVTSQVLINTRGFFGVHPKSAFLASAFVYIYSHITKDLVVKDLLLMLQADVNAKIPKFVKPHFKNCTNGDYGIQKPTTLTSNMGAFECENCDIWGAGGMTQVPETMRPLRTFTSHICSVRGHGNVNFTFVSPGCDDAFIEEFVGKTMWFFENPELAVGRLVLE